LLAPFNFFKHTEPVAKPFNTYAALIFPFPQHLSSIIQITLLLLNQSFLRPNLFRFSSRFRFRFRFFVHAILIVRAYIGLGFLPSLYNPVFVSSIIHNTAPLCFQQVIIPLPTHALKPFLIKMLCSLISFAFTIRLYTSFSTCTQASIASRGKKIDFCAFCSTHMQDQHLPTISSCHRSTRTFYFRSPILRV